MPGRGSFGSGDSLHFDDFDDDAAVNDDRMDFEDHNNGKAGASTSEDLRAEYLEVGRKFREVQRRRKALDETMAELKEAVLLRMELDKCASERKQKSVEVDLEAKFLFPDTMLISARIANHSGYHFKNWHLAFTFSPQGSSSSQLNGPITSEAVPLHSLPAGHRFDVHLTSLPFYEAALLVEVTLYKRFAVGGDSKIFRIELDPHLLTKWEQLQREPFLVPRATDRPGKLRTASERNEERSQSLFVPHKLLYLLLGGTNASRDAILDYILPHALTKDLDGVPVVTAFLPLANTAAEVRVEVRREPLGTTVEISAASSVVVAQLLTGLQRRILLHLTRIWRQPKDQLSLPPALSLDESNLATVWKDTVGYWR